MMKELGKKNRIDRELKRAAKKNKRNTKYRVKYLKKVGITLSE